MTVVRDVTLAAVAVLVSTACLASQADLASKASTPEAALSERQVVESASAFASPGDFVGQQITVCGYMRDRFEDTNIWPDEDASESDERGLRLLSFDGEAGRRQRDGRLGCVTGTIEWAGCRTTSYCTSSGFDYGIRLSTQVPHSDLGEVD